MISNDNEEASTAASTSSRSAIKTFRNITTKVQGEKEKMISNDDEKPSISSEGGNEDELDSIVKGLKREKEKMISNDDEDASTCCSHSDNEEEDSIFEAQEETEKISNANEELIISSQGTDERDDSIFEEGINGEKETISNDVEETSSQGGIEEEDSIFQGISEEKGIISNDNEEPIILSLSSSKRVSFGKIVTYEGQEKEISDDDDDDEKYCTSSWSCCKFVSLGDGKFHEEERRISNEYCTSCIDNKDSIDEEGSSYFSDID